MPDSVTSNKSLTQWAPLLGRLALFIAQLYLFLVGIELLSSTFKSTFKEMPASLAEGLSNPFAGLAVGVLATVLVQSSSVTTSIIVGMVGEGILPLPMAVPMVMGANIGTTITNTLVSTAYTTRNEEFRRAFAGATVHDFFNLLSVAILLPLELATRWLTGIGWLQHSAEQLAQWMPAAGGKFNSPIKLVVKWLAKKVHWVLADGLHLAGGWLTAALLLTALAIIMLTLFAITKNMKRLMADRIEQWLNRVLTRSGVLGVMIGMVITVLVQSSSITTSLLVPMFGAGLLTLEAGFPIMVGANIGTTVTALLAALVAGPHGLIIALVHLLFNLTGTAVFFAVKPMRSIPIWCANRLALMATHNRLWVLVYIGIVFVGLPIVGILIWK